MRFEGKELCKGYETVKESKKGKQQTLPTASCSDTEEQHRY